MTINTIQTKYEYNGQYYDSYNAAAFAILCDTDGLKFYDIDGKETEDITKVIFIKIDNKKFDNNIYNYLKTLFERIETYNYKPGIYIYPSSIYITESKFKSLKEIPLEDSTNTSNETEEAENNEGNS